EQPVANRITERPAHVGQVLPVNNLRSAFAGVKNVLDPPVSATVMADGGDVCRELVALPRKESSRSEGAWLVQHLLDPGDGCSSASAGLAVTHQRGRLVRADAWNACQHGCAGGVHIDQSWNVLVGGHRDVALDFGEII